MALSAKQKLFARAYIITFNATQAAKEAGYSEKTAYSQGQRLLKNVEIKKEIDLAKAERLERLQIDADYVLNRMVEIDQMDYAEILDEHGAFKPVDEWPLVWRQTIAGMDISEIHEWDPEEEAKVFVGHLKKIKMPDRLKNLELMGKHVKVQAFLEKTKDTGLESLAEAIRAGRKRTGNNEEEDNG